MSGDKFWSCDIKTLLQWIIAEEKNRGTVLGISKDLFFVPKKSDPFRMVRYNQLLETPLGVAAGPHTQLSQNIVAAWLTGTRYMELKTVQVLDELEVTKPCIDMADEGYNCEWSQELKLDQSFDEYLNAWILLHVLKDKFGWGEPGERGFIFNMSVGYNLDGILSPTVQRFLDRMRDCSKEKASKIEELEKVYPRVRDLDIPDCVSDNITVSTMHGCPPDEVEKIGRYFVEERKLNTTIKLNPTLLGPERLRDILNNKLGFETVVPDLAFEHDLKYEAGVALIRSLLDSAKKSGVAFNIKLTNTLETDNTDQNLPDHEKMVYMSGRALHPISINLAARLQNEFDGALDISFSAGTDCFNIADVLACGLKPVTVCSDLLKPGGYGRLSQYVEELGRSFKAAGAQSVDDYARISGGVEKLNAYAESVLDVTAYHKGKFPYEGIKTERKLAAFDCVQAPCMSTCPVGQNIPGYMHFAAKGDFVRAHEIILETNPFPTIQGMVCDQLCREKCTRINYDDPLLIREMKRFIVANSPRPKLRPAEKNGISVAVIGAGPSGLACAHFLALDGFSVEVFEAKPFAGGWASDAIPAFRLDDKSVKQDIDAILALGVDIHYNASVTPDRFEQLRKDFDYVYIAVGAQEAISLGIPGEDAEGVIDQLAFLSAVRRGEKPNLGKRVVVIGGGNSAMDAARTAKRLVGPDGEVSVVYRRTRKEMPAAAEEIQGMLDEGVKLVELTAPECMLVEDGRVKSNVCFSMELGEKDASGRARPVKIEGSEFEIDADTIISAIGQRVNVDFLPGKELRVDPVTRETQIPNVFAGGDAIRGASTLIRAIGDGKKVAESIRARAITDKRAVEKPAVKSSDPAVLLMKKARRKPGAKMPETAIDRRGGFDMVVSTLSEETARKEADRCLHCDELCNTCVTVCPNRANIAYVMAPQRLMVRQARKINGQTEIADLETLNIVQTPQVLNIGDFCNECGNCATFCPTSGSPYLDKPKFHISAESFESAQFGYHFYADNRLACKREDKIAILAKDRLGFMYESDNVRVVLDESLTLAAVTMKTDSQDWISLRPAVEMAVLFRAVRDILPKVGA